MEAACHPLLTSLRGLLKEYGVDAYIIPSSDDHQSEYVSACDERRRFISNFSGSAGTAVVTLDAALLWTDGRYFLQADKELYPGWKLMKMGAKDVPVLTAWISKNVKGNIGIDPKVYSIRGYNALASALDSSRIKSLNKNLIDMLWKDRPSRPAFPIIEHPLSAAGVSAKKKIETVFNQMEKKGADFTVISALDEVAYLLNLRGSDIAYNPVFYGYVLLQRDEGKEAVSLFINKEQLKDQNVKLGLSSSGVKIFDMTELSTRLQSIPKKKVGWLDPSKCSFWLRLMCVEGKDNCNRTIIENPSPVAMMKAIKNSAELEGIIKPLGYRCMVSIAPEVLKSGSHEVDAAALVRFFHWLDGKAEQLFRGKDAGKETKEKAAFDEWFLSEKVESFRRRSAPEIFVGPSFATVSSIGPNGAIIHYTPSPETAAKVDDKSVYLLDSGGQYRCGGTTDVTRTIHLGTPTEYEKRCFTRVLQGHIALASAVFPEGTAGPKLDVLARGALWKDGLDYRHGTGHGVGSYLNVHEGPHGISASTSNVGIETTPLLPGMLTTNEPGFYQNGQFGMRIENMMVVRDFEFSETSTKESESAFASTKENDGHLTVIFGGGEMDR
eukprot:CAMPEP_0114510298 /NCGR_PEP_ID=MMETSP0109-20121206/13704_1 /TAXON_ID=29199 /ORGANISM="Chlorarachnion reptans, Strain CCCM449" /LENGTH=608 /DNA_ID=CAMNT_0001689579 /DNA_START=122 /DNA_END=1947 /DNA_ORIENTATION=-